MAAYWGSVDAAKLLIEQGADVNITDKNGQTLLDFTKKLNLSNVITLLEEEGAKGAE